MGPSGTGRADVRGCPDPRHRLAADMRSGGICGVLRCRQPRRETCRGDVVGAGRARLRIILSNGAPSWGWRFHAVPRRVRCGSSSGASSGGVSYGSVRLASTSTGLPSGCVRPATNEGRANSSSGGQRTSGIGPRPAALERAESMRSIQTTEDYLRVDVTQRIGVLMSVTPPQLRPGKFRPPDALIASLNG